jgi:hypothetical protein
LSGLGHFRYILRPTILFNPKIVSAQIADRMSCSIRYRNRERYQICTDADDIRGRRISGQLRIQGLAGQSDYRALTGAHTEKA